MDGDTVILDYDGPILKQEFHLCQWKSIKSAKTWIIRILINN